MAGKIIYYGTGINKDHSGRWRDGVTPAEKLPYEEARAFFPGAFGFVAGLQAAVAAANTDGGGTVFVGCDYGDGNDSFKLDYRSSTPTLVIKDRHNVVIDFGGATLRQTNFARLVLDTNDVPIRPTEGTPKLGADGRWIGVGFPMVRIENCTNLRIENLILDGNRSGALEAGWGSEPDNNPPDAHNQQLPDHGLMIVGCQDIVLRNVHARELQMDGFQVFFATSGPPTHSRRITFEDCSAVRCARGGFGGDFAHELKLIRCYAAENGLDLGSGAGLRKAQYAGPADGARFESFVPVQALDVPFHRQITVVDCTFERNGGYGVAFTGHNFPDGVLVSSCLFDDNARRTTYGGVAGGRSHLLIAGSGATVQACAFRPITTAAAIAEQRPLVEVKVNAIDGAGEAWRKAGHRLVGNRFVGADEDVEDMTFARRFAIEVTADFDPAPEPDLLLSDDAGCVVERNAFQRCWSGVQFRAPFGVFNGNTFLDGLAIAGASAHQGAVVLKGFAHSARVVDNLFWNAAGRALWIESGTPLPGSVGCEDLTFANNIVRYTDTNLLHPGAVHLMGMAGGRARLLDNVFERTAGAADRAAIFFELGGGGPGVTGIVLRGNIARGSGWWAGAGLLGPWRMDPVAHLANVIESWSNHPPLPGQAGTQAGRGLLLEAADTSLASVPGTLWYENGGNGRWMAQDEVGSRPVVRGPTSSSDNFLPRFDGTTGALLQGSSVSVDDSGNLILGSSSKDVQFGATVGGSYRRIRGVAGGLSIEDTTGSNTATITLSAAHVDLDAFQHVTVRQAGTAWARFTSAQRLGVGTTAPGHRLHVVDTQSSTHVAQVENLSTSSGASGLRVRINATPTHEANLFVRFSDSGYTKGSISGTAGGSGCLYNTSSDARLKSGIRPAPAMLPAVLQIEVSQFESAQNPVVTEIGFIAQQLNRHYPDATTDPAALNRRKVVSLRAKDHPEDPLEERLVFPEELPALETDPTLHIDRVEPLAEGHAEYMYWQVDYSKLTPALTGAIQELHALVQTQAEQIAALTAAVAALAARLGPVEGG